MDEQITAFFKGRIGQAILETTLLQFGYNVERLGCTITSVKDETMFVTMDTLPDLLVTDPDDGGLKRYLEVKLQVSHPLEVLIGQDQVTQLRKNWTGSLLVFISPYNGSINCLEIENPMIDTQPQDGNGFYRIGLLSEAWKPLWEYFPKVNRSEKTDDLWHEMKAVMTDFAANRLTASKETGFFAEEETALRDYIQKHWHPGMMVQDISAINVDVADIADVWEHAMDIHAFRFAFDLCGGEANMDHPAFSQIMEKLRGKIGERFVTIPYREIKEALTEYPDVYKELLELEEEVRNTSPWDSAFVLMDGLIRIIPEGIGSAWIMAEKGGPDAPIEVDFRTMLVLMQRRNCLYD